MSIEQSDEHEEVESLNQELEKYQHKASILSKSTMSQTESEGPHRNTPSLTPTNVNRNSNASSNSCQTPSLTGDSQIDKILQIIQTKTNNSIYTPPRYQT